MILWFVYFCSKPVLRVITIKALQLLKVLIVYYEHLVYGIDKLTS